MDTSILPPTSTTNCMELNLLPPTSIVVSVELMPLPWKLPWELVETSTEVDRAEVGAPFWTPYESCWKFVILVKAGEVRRGIRKLMEACAEYISGSYS